MDFQQFVKDYSEQHGIDNVNLSCLNKIRVVKFDVDERGYISGKVLEGIVYRHREYESTINAGEMWICELQENVKNCRQHFAKPIMKVDASFIYDLTSSQLGELAQYIWKNNRDSIEGMLKEEYADTIEKMAEEKAEDMSKRNQDEIDALNGEISSLRKTNTQLQECLDMTDEAILELKDTLTQERAVKTQCQKEIVLLRSQLDTARRDTVVRKDCDHVIRMAPNYLYSEDLMDGKYSVYVTANKSKLLIERNDRGRMTCTNNTLQLFGFDNILPFDTVEKLNCTTDKEGRMTVFLPERMEA